MILSNHGIEFMELRHAYEDRIRGDRRRVDADSLFGGKIDRWLDLFYILIAKQSVFAAVRI